MNHAETTHAPRSDELLSRDDSRLIVIDVQRKLLPHIPDADVLIESCRRLIDGADVLGVPVQATEQYPRGLGPTHPDLAERLGEIPEKLRFSAAPVLGLPSAARAADDRDKLVLCGIEAHVCVLQTAFDLLSLGYRVFVVADAVASRRPLDRDVALRRLSDGGATVTTVESVLFEWCEEAGSDEFKQISRIVTGR